MSENKVTKEDLLQKVTDVKYFQNGKTTVCVLRVQNGYEIVGTSACIDPANFDEEIGRKIAKDEALDKLWELEGYLLQEQLYLDGLEPSGE